MARIRSVHPGLFTDEAFVTLSPLARLLLIGIWTECDDHGVFDWKPLTLKMRVLPADNVDTTPLMEELTTADAIMTFLHEGKSYGAVRNFGKFQKPKKPAYRYPMPEEVAKYTSFKGSWLPSSTPDVPHQGYTSSEKSRQREEGIGIGGGEGKGEETRFAAAAAERADDFESDDEGEGIGEILGVPVDMWSPTNATSDDLMLLNAFSAKHIERGTFSTDWDALWEDFRKSANQQRAKARPAPRIELTARPPDQPVVPSPPCEEAVKLAAEIAAMIDFGEASPPRRTIETTLDAWIRGGWKPDLIASAIGAKAARLKAKNEVVSSLNFFKPDVARAHATAAEPLPTSSAKHGKTYGRNESKSLTDAARRLAAKLAADDGGGAENGGDQGGGIARAISAQ